MAVLEEYFQRHSEAVIQLWAASHARLTQGTGMGLLAEAAARVVLTQLRPHQDLPALLQSNAGDLTADFALIESLVSAEPGSDLPCSSATAPTTSVG